MRIFLIIALLAFGADLLPDDAERDGRRGNDLYEDGAYDEAAEAFAEGLAVLSEDSSLRLRYGLHNNFGAALLKSGNTAEARRAFERAIGTAPTDADVARSAYNAGNAAHASEDLQAAVDFYRQSLLRNPDNQAAKFNYEFVKRQLEQQQNEQQQQQGDSDQPDEEQDEQNSGEQNRDGDPQEDEQQQEENDGSQNEQENGESQEEPSHPQEQSGERPQDQLSEAQAERILQALQNEEEQLLRQVQRPDTRPRRVEKDW